MIGLLAVASLLPFLIAAGTCYIKFSIVFVIVRNALGLQQVPSNMTLNAVALLLAMFVMSPVVQEGYDYYKENRLSSPTSMRWWRSSITVWAVTANT